MSVTGWLVLLLCLFVTGLLFFSVNSRALRMFSLVKLQNAFKSRRKDELADFLTENAEKLELVCALYRIIFNVLIVLALFGLFMLRRSAVPVLSDYALVFLLSLVIFSVFGLAIPHAWAKYRGEKVLAVTFGFLMFLGRVSSVAIYFFGAYDTLIRRLAGVPASGPDEQEEEFLNVVEESKKGGLFGEEEQQMIKQVLELRDTTVEEVMTPRTDMVAVSVDSNLQTLLEVINLKKHSRMPVYQGSIDNIIGFLYAKDLLRLVGRDSSEFVLRDNLREAYFIPETKPLRALLDEFKSQKLHIAVVLDEYGGTAGLVSIEDILEEVVGEIADEYEKTVPESLKKIDETTAEIDARMYIDDLNSGFEVELPEDEDYDTVGGFVFSHLGYIPRAGEKFEYHGLKFEITSAEPRRINRIRVQKTAKQFKQDTQDNA